MPNPDRDQAARQDAEHERGDGQRSHVHARTRSLVAPDQEVEEDG
jgi:hypothetical protein